jgi:hypothetical protein
MTTFTSPNSVHIASNEAQRIAEVQDRQTSYGNEASASTDQRVKNDAGDKAQYCKEEAGRLGGAGAFPVVGGRLQAK